MIDQEESTEANTQDSEELDVSFTEDEEEYQDDSQNLQQQITELNHRLLYVMAERDNMSQRHERILEETKDYAVTGLIKELVAVMDNLERALEHAQNSEDINVKNMALGVQMTKDSLQSIFTKYGVSVIEPKAGDKFDYRLHHAIKSEDAGQEEDAIIQTVQVGYSIKNRLVRSAMVIVQQSVN